MLKSLPRKVGDDRVFWFASDPDYVSQVWREAARDAGLQGITLHDLKHTFCSLMRKQGIPPDVTARVAGNDDLGTIMRRYENFGASLGKQAVGTLDALWSPKILHGVTGNEPSDKVT